jgi:hypothetical protein
MLLKRVSKKFLSGFLITFFVGMIWPISVVLNIGHQGWRWIQNSPGKTIFWIVFFPLAVGIFFSIVRWKSFLQMKSIKRYIMGGFLILLGIFAVVIIINDTIDNSRPSAPYEFRGQQKENALKEEINLRKEAKAILESTGHPRTEELLEQYKKKVPPFDSIKDFLKRGSFAAYWIFFLKLISVLFLILFFWFLFFMIISKHFLSTQEFNGLLVCYSFLIGWFPLMLHSEWYFNFYNLNLLKYSNVVLPISFFSIVCLILLITIKKPYVSIAIVSLINVVATLTSGILVVFKSELVQKISIAIENMQPFSIFFIIGVLLMTMIALLNKIHHLFNGENVVIEFSEGSLLAAKYRNKEYNVKIIEDRKFLYDGKRYQDLSEVAKAITGKDWSLLHVRDNWKLVRDGQPHQ